MTTNEGSAICDGRDRKLKQAPAAPTCTNKEGGVRRVRKLRASRTNAPEKEFSTVSFNVDDACAMIGIVWFSFFSLSMSEACFEPRNRRGDGYDRHT